MEKNTVNNLGMICQYNKLCFILLAGKPFMHYTNTGSQ